MISTIMSAIVYSHYVEALAPGTFQQNMKEMFKMNGLQPVNFPTPPMNDVVLQACRNAFGTNDRQTNDNDKQTSDDKQTPLTSDNRQTENNKLSTHNMDNDNSKEESNKRIRQSLSPPIKNEKKEQNRMRNSIFLKHQNLRNRQTKTRVYLNRKWEHGEGEEEREGMGINDLITHLRLQLKTVELKKLV